MRNARNRQGQCYREAIGAYGFCIGSTRIFMQWDGVKKRINTRATFITIAVCFLITAVIGVFHKQKIVITGKSPVNMNLAIGQETLVPVYNPTQAKVQSAVHGGGKRTSLDNLTITRRNPAGKVPPGTFVRARLLSDASNGFVKAELLENVAPYGGRKNKASKHVVHGHLNMPFYLAGRIDSLKSPFLPSQFGSEAHV